jgi:2',3'-cyclic-nucleotide 2'-phosphodiesterase (5'-nucleotidase family)
MAQNLAICLTPDQCHLFSVDYPVFNKAGLKVGLFALTEPAVFTLSPATLKKQLKVFEPVETAQGAVSNYKAQGVDLVVLLYHGAAESARMLVKQVPGLDLVILGHEQYLINGEKIGKTWLFSPGEEGNRLGEVVVTFANKKIKSVQNSWRLFHYEQDPDDAAVRERIKRYYTERFGQ